MLGRGYAAMEAGFRRVLGRVPFPIRELHPDNGGEFFNHHLLRFWGAQITGLRLSRSRPYQKNDNRLVEQKNDTLVRAYVGHGRLETAGQAALLDQIYEACWGYYNLFQPVLHLREKALTAGTLRRKWDTAATPYQRLAATEALDDGWRATLDAQRARTNPRQLRRAIYADLARLWQSPSTRAMAADRGCVLKEKGGRPTPGPSPVTFSDEGAVAPAARSVTFSVELTRVPVADTHHPGRHREPTDAVAARTAPLFSLFSLD